VLATTVALSHILPVVARQPKTLLEVNVLLAAGSLMTDAERAAGKRLPIMRQARLMAKAMPRAMRLGEFVAMWAIVKYENGAVTVEELAEYWGEPHRTMYRRLSEFREVWGPVGYESPDALADGLIADFRRRKERMHASHLARLLSAEVPTPAGTVPSGLSG